jgi:hypothetical protein
MNLTKSQKAIVVLSSIWLFISLIISAALSDSSYGGFSLVGFVALLFISSSPVWLYWAGVWIWGFGYITRNFKRVFVRKSMQSETELSKSKICSFFRWFKSVWRGERTLARVFWVYGILCGAGLKIAMGGIISAFASLSDSNDLFVIIIIATTIFYFIYVIWILVSIWRSAFNTKYKFWGYVARLYVIIVPLIFIISSANS